MAMIFQMTADANRYASFSESGYVPTDFKVLDSGCSLSSIWTPKKVMASPGPLADCVRGPLFVASISLNAKAATLLGTLLDSLCELVPYTHSEWTYWALYILRPTDCLDQEGSEYWGEKGASSLRKVVFDPEKLPKDQHIFRLPGGIAYYVTESFKQTVEAAAITGLQFRFVWSSDGSTPPPENSASAAKVPAHGAEIRRRRTKRDKILERLWEAIDRIGSSDWMSETLTTRLEELHGAQDVLIASPEVLGEATRRGVPPESLSRMCRSIAYQAVFEALVAIEEEGLDKPAALSSLHESLLMADPQK